MKRSPELTPLSHDHHQALFVAQCLRRATDAAGERERFLEFWRTHGRRHFVIEEEVLLPGWFEHDPEADPAAAARLAAEHLAIRTAARRLRDGELPAEELHALGDKLNDHVRYEERELFGLIESRLDPAALSALGAEIEAAERAPAEGGGDG